MAGTADCPAAAAHDCAPLFDVRYRLRIASREADASPVVQASLCVFLRLRHV